MDSIVINPKNREELKLIKTLLAKMKVKSKILTEEEMEDLGLSILMRDIDRTDTVSEKDILSKLAS
ncbi:hypothetical protein [Ekhidna sp.]|uniref:hypothetical protein n=1 Tax=Ekhidna sp. TaxID=2608089 RepID=UPI00351603FA